MRAVEIRPLDRSEYDAAALIFAGAFLDDPGWVAVGPDRRGHRHSVLRRYHRTAPRVYEEAEAPVYLDTANPANVPYYASNGFEEIGKADGPRGATMWFMRRP
jgi:predicted GNAT superfamily acetyltransferase